MSFDIHLMAFRKGQPVPANREAAQAFIDSIDHKLEPDFNAYNLTLNDGTQIEMYATGLHTNAEPFQGAMIALRGLSNAICDFIYDFCVASSCIAIPKMDPGCVLVPDETMAIEFPEGFTDEFPVVHIRSGADVAVALEGGYDAWAAFRDRVLRNPENGG